MTNVSINRTEYYEISHNLFPYDGKCYSLHGHSYKVTVEITGPQADLGMIMDFKVLKTIMNVAIPDHAYIYNKKLLNSEEENLVQELVPLLEKYEMNVVGYDTDTTCENLVRIWADKINRELVAMGYKDVYVSKLYANETQNSQAVYTAPHRFNTWVKTEDGDIARRLAYDI